MVVSASRARFQIHSLGLACKLYLGPFSSNIISCSQNIMLVVLITLGWKLWCSWGFLFVVGISGLVFCPVFCILIGFLFGVCLLSCRGCGAIGYSRYWLVSGVGGILVCSASVFCSVGILFRL